MSPRPAWCLLSRSLWKGRDGPGRLSGRGGLSVGPHAIGQTWVLGMGDIAEAYWKAEAQALYREARLAGLLGT